MSWCLDSQLVTMLLQKRSSHFYFWDDLLNYDLINQFFIQIPSNNHQRYYGYQKQFEVEVV